MKINNIVKIAVKRVKQNRKRNTMLVLPLVIILVLLHCANMVQYSMQKYIESIEENIELRTIGGINYNSSKYNEILEKITQIEHIQMVTSELERHIFATIYCKQFITDKDEGNIEIKPINNRLCPEVIEGRKIEDSDEYAIIIPSRINTNDQLRNIEYRNHEKEYINGENFIGEEIEIIFLANQKIYKKTFKVIGIYDSDRYINTKNVYIPAKIIKNINEEIGQEERYFQLEIVVDKIENMEEVEKNLYEYGIIEKSAIQEEATIGQSTIGTTKEVNFSSITNISVETQRIIQKLILVLILVAFIILTVMIIVTNTNKTYLSMTEIGLLKVEGYTNKDIHKITILENIIICLISIIISLIFFIILRALMNLTINYIVETKTVGITINKIREQIFYIKKIPQKINILFIALISLVTIFIETVNTYFNNKKILSKDIVKILKG